MLLVVIYLYATSLTLWGLNITLWFKRATDFFVDDSTILLLDRMAASNVDLELVGTPMESLFLFNMIVGDSVVIWRAWVLYHRTLWVLSAPCLMLLMSFIFSVIDMTCLTGAGWSSQTTLASGGAICEHAELTSWAFSFVTNATCTILIGYKAWYATSQHRRTTKALQMSVNSSRMSTNRILSLIVESGFVYCLFWLTQLILFFDISRDAPAIYVYQLFAGMGDQISGMYPTLIIVIVNLHQTIWDEPSTGNNDSALHFKRSDTTGPFNSQDGAKVHLDTDISSTRGISRGKISNTTFTEEV
ncbi:hypothetical protein C8R44DRAFT_640443 [Mycena epipterygia]|nr:hypothetical protein C8R44DRAFT_640443 [Mycena epipterygia]